MMMIAITMTMAGYIMADCTLPLTFWAFSWNSARRFRTTSSTPPNSPAFTMFT